MPCSGPSEAVKYKIVEKSTSSELMEAVQKLLDQGWYLHGTLVVVPGFAGNGYRTHPTYCQVLTQCDDDPI